MHNETQDSAPESLSPSPTGKYELNTELISLKTREFTELLRKEGLGKREVIDTDTGIQRVRDLIWEDESDLTVLDRCQVLQDVLHELATA